MRPLKSDACYIVLFNYYQLLFLKPILLEKFNCAEIYLLLTLMTVKPAYDMVTYH